MKHIALFFLSVQIYSATSKVDKPKTCSLLLRHIDITEFCEDKKVVTPVKNQAEKELLFHQSVSKLQAKGYALTDCAQYKTNGFLYWCFFTK